MAEKEEDLRKRRPEDKGAKERRIEGRKKGGIWGCRISLLPSEAAFVRAAGW